MNPLGCVLTFGSVVTAMVLFRARTLEGAGRMLKGMLGFDGISLPNGILARFSGLNETERESISNGFAQGQLAAGSALFQAGDGADALFMIGAGFVRLSTEGGQLLATLGPGSVLGDTALFRGANHDVNATAVSPVEYWTLSDRTLRALVREQPPAQQAQAQLRLLVRHFDGRAPLEPAAEALAVKTSQCELAARVHNSSSATIT